VVQTLSPPPDTVGYFATLNVDRIEGEESPFAANCIEKQKRYFRMKIT
jgi:hypothetical protein